MLHPTLSPTKAFSEKVDTGFPQKKRSNKESRAPSDSTQLESALEAFPGSLIAIVVLDSGLMNGPLRVFTLLHDAVQSYSTSVSPAASHGGE